MPHEWRVHEGNHGSLTLQVQNRANGRWYSEIYLEDWGDESEETARKIGDAITHFFAKKALGFV